MDNENFYTRRMNRDEIDTAIQWAAVEGWNPGLHDADCFFSTDPNGYFIGMLDDKPVGCISAVSYDKSFGFLGFYIVSPAFRGQGYGIRIWDAGLEYLGSRNIGLDGVIDQQDNYKKSGFNLAYRNIRYQGSGTGLNDATPEVIRLSEVSFKHLIEYDNALFPASRSRFLKSWIEQPEGAALGVLRDGSLVGYSVIRKCQLGYKIGPLFADDDNLAELLFSSIQNRVEENMPIFLDVPEVNPEAVSLAERHNMEKVFETARMYSGAAPELPLHRIFSVTSFELG